MINLKQQRITIARGDGIGPEIMESCLNIMDKAQTNLVYDEIQIGQKVYEQKVESGIEPSSWDTLLKNKIFFKAPITTPQGGGFKSLNVTIRKSLGLYANIRPVKALVPYVRSFFPTMDLVVIRENEEDLYAGIEHQQSNEVVQCLKLVSKPGCERIIRYAFEYARAYGRKKVTCMSKDNIMKLTDGLFHKTFDRIKLEYPEIETDHFIIDIGAARLADTPHWFDVIVTLNLYGDIISDITAQISGSVGLGGSANIGSDFAMFEAIHGSAPDISGQDIANPCGLLHGGIMMLAHLNMNDKAELIMNATLKTIEDGIHTKDMTNKHFTKKEVGTKEFTQAIIDRLGEEPKELKKASYGSNSHQINVKLPVFERKEKTLVGVDIFLDWDEENRNPNALGKALEKLDTSTLKLKMLNNRGVEVYPEGFPQTFCTDHWRCRYFSTDATETVKPKISFTSIVELLEKLNAAGYDCIKTENLYNFDGERGYSAGQGE